MQDIRELPGSRSQNQFSRLSLAGLVLGICAFACLTQRAGLGQTQFGAAESCFDQAPDNPPSSHVTAAPSLRAELPARLAQVVANFGIVPAKSPAATPAPAKQDDSRNKSRWMGAFKSPEGTMTAAR